MAYDPKDPDTIKAVKAAVDEALAEATETHEADIAGLKKKNTDLILANKELKAGKGDANEVAKLEGQIEVLEAKVADGNKTVKALTKERDTLKVTAETETAASRKLLVDNGLTEQLIANNVDKRFLPAVKKLLADQVIVKADGDSRVAMVGDKSLSDFVKTWSQGDEGKAFVTAPANGGGNAPGGKANGNGKVIARSAYEANPAAYAAELRGGATLDPNT